MGERWKRYWGGFGAHPYSNLDRHRPPHYKRRANHKLTMVSTWNLDRSILSSFFFSFTNSWPGSHHTSCCKASRVPIMSRSCAGKGGGGSPAQHIECIAALHVNGPSRYFDGSRRTTVGICSPSAFSDSNTAASYHR